MSNEDKSCGGGGGGGASRTLRHKERQRYLDDEGLTPTLDGAEVGDGPGFSLDEKLASNAYNADLVKEIKTNELNLKYLQKHGFHSPLLFHNKEGLGMKIPASDFSVNDVKHLVGARRIVDVVDVQTQKAGEMMMKDFVKYYERKPSERTHLFNVISLEFSKTRMEALVQAPSLVRQIDWVESVWPQDLKVNHSDSTNNIKTMKYPKVQKYVLMSVEKCYTDFHIDFGGTSVWYHVLRGKKIFWLIPSTAENFELYIDWTLSGNQDKVFFGDIVAQCQRVTLKAGDTFMIPTGWIHAVYTPEDSLVFGGNFLHSYNMTKQLQVAAIEDNTRVPEKFRYPLFHEMHWYVLERYVSVLTGSKSFLVADPPPPPATPGGETSSASSANNSALTPSASNATPKLLTSHEVEGLEQLILFLEHSSPASKVPHKIRNSAGLLRAGKQLLSAHRSDDPQKAVTGIPILPPLAAVSMFSLYMQKKQQLQQQQQQHCAADTPSSGNNAQQQQPPLAKSDVKPHSMIPSQSVGGPVPTPISKSTTSNLVAPPGATIVPAPPRPSTTAAATLKQQPCGVDATTTTATAPTTTMSTATTAAPMAATGAMAQPSGGSAFPPNPASYSNDHARTVALTQTVGSGLTATADGKPRPFVAQAPRQNSSLTARVIAESNPNVVSPVPISTSTSPAVTTTSSHGNTTSDCAMTTSNSSLSDQQAASTLCCQSVESTPRFVNHENPPPQVQAPPEDQQHARQSQQQAASTESTQRQQQQQQSDQKWKQQHEQYLQQQQLLQQNYPNTSFSAQAPSPCASSSSTTGASTVVIPAPALTLGPVAASVPSAQQQHLAPHLHVSQSHPQLALQIAPPPPPSSRAPPSISGVAPSAVHSAQAQPGSSTLQQASFVPHQGHVASQQQQVQQPYAQISHHPPHPVAYPVTTFIQSFDPIPQLQQQQLYQQHHHHQQQQQQQPSSIIAPGVAVSSAGGGIPVAVVPQRHLPQQYQQLQQQPPTLSPQPMVSVPPQPVSGLQHQSSQSGTASPCLGGISQSRVGGGETPPTMNSDLASMPRSDESPMDVYDPSKPSDKSMSKRSASARRRRTRCRRCLACTRSDCGDCVYCKDMKKFGGPGRMKQSCLSRQCMAPVLPHTAVCMICGDDERIAPDGTILLSGVHAPPGSEADSKTTLMECGICWEILHPKCLFAKLRIDPAAYSHLSEGGNINQELPNSWECPKCCLQGKGGSLKPRILKQGGRGRSSSGSRASSPSGSVVGTPGAGSSGAVVNAPYSSSVTSVRSSSHAHQATTSTAAAGFYPIVGGAGLSQDALQQLHQLQQQQQLQQRLVREVRSSTPPSEDEDESENEEVSRPLVVGPTMNQQQRSASSPSQGQLIPEQTSEDHHVGAAHHPTNAGPCGVADHALSSSGGDVGPTMDHGVASGGAFVITGTAETSGSFIDALVAADAADAADAGDSSATEEGDGGERIMMMVASEKSDMASNGSGIDGGGGGGAFVERSDGYHNNGNSSSGQKKKVKKRKADEIGDSPPGGGGTTSPRKRIKMPSGTLTGVGMPLASREGATQAEMAARLGRNGGVDDGSDNESESESEGEMMNCGGVDGGRGGGASSGGNSSDSDTGDNSKDAPSRGAPHMQNGGKIGVNAGVGASASAEDQGICNGGTGVALTPKQMKKQLKGKLKSMTRLERQKWLKRAKKELVKRFGGSFDGDAENDKVKVEPETEDAGRRNEDAGDDVFEVRGSKTLADLRVVVEKYMVRPWEDNKDEHDDEPSATPSSPRRNSDDAIWFNVFRHFTRKELCQCSLVSRSWFKWANDQRLWKECAIRNRHVKAAYLVGLVRRQPESLDLSWTDLSAKQLLWLLQRLPRLKSLRLAGLSQSTVEALGTTSTPLLRKLSLAEADSITDAIVRDIIGPPADYRPGIFETKSRMRYLTSLSFKGCDISDITLRFMTIHLKFVESLDLSYCTLLSDDGLDALTGNEGSAFQDSLQQILLVGLPKITGQALTHLSRCSSLVEIDLTRCASMTEEACRLFIALNVHMPLILVPDSNFLIRANSSFLPIRDEDSLAS